MNLEESESILKTLEARVNEILASNDDQIYFLVVFPIADLIKDISEWPGDKDHLNNTLDTIVSAIYSNAPFTEGHFQNTAHYLIYPEGITFKNIPEAKLPKIHFSRVPDTVQDLLA